MQAAGGNERRFDQYANPEVMKNLIEGREQGRGCFTVAAKFAV